MTSETTEYGRTVRFPVSRAGRMSAVGEWKAALTSQPRPHRPRPRQRERYLLFRMPSVVTPQRPGMKRRPGNLSTARLNCTSAQLNFIGRW